MSLHHTQLKQAAALGISVLKDGFRHDKTGQSVPLGKDARATFAAFVAQISGASTKPAKAKTTKKPARAKTKRASDDEGDEEDEEGDDRPATSGMLDRAYYDAYQKKGNGCADDLDLALREGFRIYKLGKKGQQTKDYRFDLEGFIKWAKATSCWRPHFASNNPGQTRMNCSNVARQMIKDGEPVRDFLKAIPKR